MSYTHVVRPELDPDQSTRAQIGRLLEAGLINPPDVPVVVMPDGALMGLEEDTCDCGLCETLYRLLPEVGPVTLFTELIDLLDLVGSRDCIHGVQIKRCGDEVCEPCTARELYGRMVEARDRVSPQDDAVRTQ